MSKKEKILVRFFNIPNDFTYEELLLILSMYGFIEIPKGKTSGSRVAFYNKMYNKKIEFHRPHPSNIIKKYIENSKKTDGMFHVEHSVTTQQFLPYIYIIGFNFQGPMPLKL